MTKLKRFMTVVAVAIPFAMHAQDMRNVTEPKIPPVCITLSAALEGTERALKSADETKLDTQRCRRRSTTADRARLLSSSATAIRRASFLARCSCVKASLC